MIYLIGGSPRSGKTILSTKLAKELNIPYFSTDYAKLMLRPYFEGEKGEEMFPFDKIWKSLTLDEYFTKYSGKDMVNIDIKEGETIWPGLEYLISRMLRSKQDHIIEGVHLLPSLLKDYNDNENIKTIFLTKLDEEKIHQGLFKNKSKNDWIMRRVEDPETLKKVAKAMSAYGDYFTKEAEKHKFKCINTEDDFQNKLNLSMKFLIN